MLWAGVVWGYSVLLFDPLPVLPDAACRGPLVQAEERGLSRRFRGAIRPTRLGTQFLNDYLMLFEAPSPATPPMDATKRAPVDRGGGSPVL